MSDKDISRRDLLKIIFGLGVLPVASALSSCLPSPDAIDVSGKLNPEQQKMYDGIIQLYKDRGIDYSKRLTEVLNRSNSDESNIESGGIVIDVPSEYLKQGDAIVKISNVLLGDMGKKYLQKVKLGDRTNISEPQTISISRTQTDSNIGFGIDDQKAFLNSTVTFIHEFFHLIDPFLSGNKNTLDQNLKLAFLRAKTVFTYDFLEIYNSMSHSTMFGQAYHNLGKHIYENKGTYTIPSLDEDWVKVQDFLLGINAGENLDENCIELGKLVFEKKLRNPQLILPQNLDDLFSNNFFPQAEQEVFAELGSDAITQYTYLDTIKLEPVIEEYLSILRSSEDVNRNITVDEIRQKLYDN